MPFILLYFLKLSVSFTGIFLFYYFVLRRLTFYNWNRVYLLASTFLSFAISYMNIEPALQHSNLADAIWVEALPHVGITNQVVLQQNNVPQAGASWNINEWIIFIILTGMTVMMLRLAIQIFSVWQMKKKADHFSDNGLHFYQVNENIIPFSFGNAVFVNKDLHTENELQKIILHEFVHVKQKHSIDILWAEFLCLVNWYNPFVWLIRKTIRQNLEFIADDKILQTGVAKKQYQYLLVKVVGNIEFSIAPKFNFSSLKKRIAMMNKIKTAKVHLVKFLFALPLVALLLIAFRNKESNENIRQPEKIANINPTHTTPHKEPVNKLSTKGQLIMAGKGNVSSVKINNNIAEVTLKSEKNETYNLKNKNEQEAFGKKYGAIIPPPPPPSAPPEPIAPPLPQLPPATKNGFTGLEGTINTGNAEKDLTPKLVDINGKLCYYTEIGNKITYYNLYGHEIDINGKVLSTTQTNASDVLPNQYIRNVYKYGELVSTFNDNKKEVQ